MESGFARKASSWTVVKENIKQESSKRKTCARKSREMYLRACKGAGAYPLTAVMDEFEHVKFDISGHRIGAKHMKIVAVILMNSEHVTSLNLRDNFLRDEGIFWVADLIPYNRSITKLNLAENGIGVPGLRAIIPAVIDNILITKIDLSGNEISDSGAKQIAELIEARTGLIELRLHHNCIGELGGVYIGNALSQNESLERLDLSWNHIRGKGAITIAHSLKSNKCLRALNVAWNGFGKEGAKAIGEALQENTKLRELDLTNNRIDANAMALLMVGLKTNETLETLKLGKNPFSSDVAKHLLLVLEKAERSAITHLELSELPVDEGFMEVLERISARRNLNVTHGKLVRKVHVQEYKPPPIPPRDPLELMFDFKYEHGYRTLDLLIRMDKDNNMVIDKEEFKNGLLEMGIDAQDDQVDELMSKLDTNSDGAIDYSELVAGEREYGSRTKRHMNMQTLQKIRSLAQAMLRMKLKDQAELALPLEKGKEAGKKLDKKEKTIVKEKTLVR